MANAMEKIQDKFRVRVIKKEDDTRISVAGEKFIRPGHPDHDGTELDGKPAEYAVIPAHHADHIAANNKQYVYSDPFIPETPKERDASPDEKKK
jgi:hypothetical protein